MFEMSVTRRSGGVKQAVVFMNLKLRGIFWARGLNARVVSAEMLSEALGMDGMVHERTTVENRGWERKLHVPHRLSPSDSALDFRGGK